MLRTFVLLSTHLFVFGLGIGIAAITYRSRARLAKAWAEALEARHLFLDVLADQHRRGVVIGTPETEPMPAPPAPPIRPVAPAATPEPQVGRHRAVNLDAPPPISLEDLLAANASAHARREQERREFIRIMTEVTGEQHPVGHARVLVGAAA